MNPTFLTGRELSIACALLSGTFLICSGACGAQSRPPEPGPVTAPLAPVQGVKPATSSSPPGTMVNGTLSAAPPGTPGVPTVPIQGLRPPTSSSPPGTYSNGTVSTLPPGTLVTVSGPQSPNVGGNLGPAQSGAAVREGTLPLPNAGAANPGSGAEQGISPGVVPGTNFLVYPNPGAQQFAPNHARVFFGGVDDRDIQIRRFRRRRNEGLLLKGTNVQFVPVPITAKGANQ